MSNIDKRALREEVQEWKEIYCYPADSENLKFFLGVEALLDELEAKDKQIAELEARTVTLPENITSANAPEVFEISSEAERLGLRGTYASYAVGWNARGIADEEALREAGVKVAAAGKGDAS
ncbi:TPA: hypothetical protein ACHFQA_000406 [Enterobacter hormaechei]